MKKFKMSDNAGNRFTVYAGNRAEAKEKAKRVSKGSVVYFED